jgi:hypothetical protein
MEYLRLTVEDGGIFSGKERKNKLLFNGFIIIVFATTTKTITTTKIL